MNRRNFLENSVALSAVARKSGDGVGRTRHDLDEITVAHLQNEFASGRWTARRIAEHYLRQIHHLDSRGPHTNAVIELNPEALSIADQLDRERRQGRVRGPLHGAPILIKDNIDTTDRMVTSAGSLALQNNRAARDAFLVARLRSAGAVILGKTNLSEWANFRSSHSVSGWSGRGGQTRNPYALDRNPCGSSSGSAVAVSANLCVAAVGTETDGSIVCPSSMNGVVGIKPTVGLISRSGIIPIAASQDTAGPIARSVRDAAVLLGVLAGTDPLDSSTQNNAGRVRKDYTQFLDVRGLRGARLGVVRKFFGTNAAVDNLIENCLSAMKREGAVLVDPADLPMHGKFGDDEYAVLLYEFKAGLNSYLSKRPPNVVVRSLADVILFNEKHAPKEMPWFQQDIMLEAEKKGPLTSRAYLDALHRSKRMAGPDGIDTVLANYKLDALVAPTAGPAWLTDWLTGDHDTGSSSQPAAVAGYPHITVPAGFVQGLPIGLSFFGAAWSEPTLLKVAFAFEQAIRARHPPRFLRTAELEPPAL